MDEEEIEEYGNADDAESISGESSDIEGVKKKEVCDEGADIEDTLRKLWKNLSTPQNKKLFRNIVHGFIHQEKRTLYV